MMRRKMGFTRRSDHSKDPVRHAVRVRNSRRYFQGSINSARALRWPNPISLRPINLRLSNPRRGPPNQRRLKRRSPALKSERRARRLVFAPNAPIWALGSLSIVSDRLWQVLPNGSGPRSVCHRSIPRSWSPAKIRIQTLRSAAQQKHSPADNREIRQARWKPQMSECLRALEANGTIERTDRRSSGT